MVDRNQAVIDFMLTCPAIHDNPLFFNAIKAQDENKEIITVSTDRILNSRFIDGSVLRRYSFSIIDFRSVSYNPVPKNTVYPGTTTDYTHENVEDIDEVQGIIDWIELQKDTGNYPDFGSDCIIDDMTTTSDMPNLNGIDTEVAPALAKYSITILIDYIDNSKKIFK